MAASKFDLTTGSIAGRLVQVALPVIGTQLLFMSYNLVDVFLLGRVGADAVSASGSAGMYLWLSNSLMLLGRMGAEIGVAQDLGRGDAESARAYSWSAAVISLIVGLIYGLACIFWADELIGIFALKEAHVAQSASRYLRIVSLSTPLVFVNSAVVGTFNGSGNTRAPFFVNMIGLGINAALDPIFIFTLGLGVDGAAIATAIGSAVSSFLMIGILLRGRGRPFERYLGCLDVSFARVRRILVWSLPICLENVLFSIFTMMIIRLVASFGAQSVAVYKVGSQVESLSWLICVGLSTAITSFVGQNYGAERWDRIASGVKIGFIAAAVWGALVGIYLAVLGGTVFRLFLPDESLAAEGERFLLILSFCQIFAGLEAASSGSFRGMGRTMPPSVINVTCNVLRVPLAWALSLKFGITGVFLGVTIGASARGTALALWFWRSMRDKITVAAKKTKGSGVR